MTKFATFREGGGAAPRIGVVHNGEIQIYDPHSAAEPAGAVPGPFESMLALMDSGPQGLDMARSLFEPRG